MKAIKPNELIELLEKVPNDKLLTPTDHGVAILSKAIIGGFTQTGYISFYEKTIKQWESEWTEEQS